MCLVAFAYKVLPHTPLLLLANRDEFFARPTAPLHHWKYPDILGGRDEKAGGTWLATAPSGAVAAVTNFRGPEEPARSRSRGEIPLDFLSASRPMNQVAEQLIAHANEFAGVNAMLFDETDALWFTNRPEPKAQLLSSGIYAISNGSLDSPWPKVEQIRTELGALLETDPQPSPSQLFGLLEDDGKAPDASLPDTGVGLELERFFSPVRIHGKRYGTRSSHLVIRTHAQLTMFERRFDEDSALCGESRRGYSLSSATSSASAGGKA